MRPNKVAAASDLRIIDPQEIGLPVAANFFFAVVNMRVSKW
jgi:hypothetical protein